MSTLESGARIGVAAIFALHGLVFVAPPAAARAKMADGPLTMRQFRWLGVAELAGAAAVLAPLATGASWWLADLAALGLLGVTVPATFLHVRRREWASTPLTAVLTIALVGLLAA